MLITVINNIISLLLTLAIVFVAPIMIAWSGFLFLVNPVHEAGISKAKSILTNTIVGIVIALAGWLIVAALMAVLYNRNAPIGNTVLGTWSQLITSGGLPFCLSQAGTSGQPSPAAPAAPAPTVSAACPASLSPITDSLAQDMENGLTVIWDNTNPRLQPCVRKFIGLIGAAGSARVTSAYRPEVYQRHLWEIRDRWCGTQGLRTNSNPACSSLKNIVSAEVTKHFGSSWSCGAVGATSRHTSGTGVDISGINQRSMTVVQNAALSCLTWRNYDGDPYHYDLNTSCPYTCN